METTPDSPAKSPMTWRPIEAFLMAGICLLIGLAVGYLLRGSARPSPVASAAVAGDSSAIPAGLSQGQMPTLEQLRHMADKQAEPLVQQLKSDPQNAALWNQLGLIYKATHQFKDAETYLQKSLDIDPRNLTTRADLASCMYYTGDADGALAELNKSLTYDPKHAETLMNIGIIKLRGKHDAAGAITAWQELLKQNPNFEQKDRIQRLIAQAQQQSSTN